MGGDLGDRFPMSERMGRAEGGQSIAVWSDEAEIAMSKGVNAEESGVMDEDVALKATCIG